MFHPGTAQSLLSHHHGAEHWIVVEGTAKVTEDQEVRLLTENQLVYIAGGLEPHGKPRQGRHSPDPSADRVLSGRR